MYYLYRAPLFLGPFATHDEAQAAAQPGDRVLTEAEKIQTAAWQALEDPRGCY
jgi:hypothetical protein